MAGYNWEKGKSNNAVQAERDGLMVASKFAKWVRQWRRYAGCQASDVAAVIDADGWHHTSKFFNRVKYYDPQEMGWAATREELAGQIYRRKLFRRIITRRGDTGRFRLMSSPGRYWYDIDLRDDPTRTALERMLETLRMTGRPLSTVYNRSLGDSVTNAIYLAIARGTTQRLPSQLCRRAVLAHVRAIYDDVDFDRARGIISGKTFSGQSFVLCLASGDPP